MTAAIIGVPTAVPVFIGYTATAPAPLTAVRLSSLADYTASFGGAPDAKYTVVAGTAADNDFAAGGQLYRLTRSSGQFNLYMAVSLFFANGGGDCFVVSVGDYNDPVSKKDLMNGLGVAQNTVGPTIVVVPDACLLTAQGEYGDVAVAQIDQCAALGDRVAILDLPGALDPAGWTASGLGASRDALYPAIAPAANAFSYGTAYAPALGVSVFGDDDVDMAGVRGMPSGADMDQVKTALLSKLNVATPCGAMAGIWASNDRYQGVWTAPAGMSVSSAIAPKAAVGDADFPAYEMPLNGNAVNLLRTMAAKGTVVWGGRTLDGNSDDYRYIQVRRTLIYIEQSIKQALNQFVFAGNDNTTWAMAVSMVSVFLTGLWLDGALFGDASQSAFFVKAGVGSTMTEQDVENGIMIVQIGVALQRPAEFIILAVEQAMQSGA